MPRTRKVILVTGSPRSGTTACGSNLALAPGVGDLFEPFNPNYGIRGISRFYEVPGANDFSMDRFDEYVEAIRNVRLNLKRASYAQENGWRGLAKRLIGDRSRRAYWRCRLDPFLSTVIWKDPIACFASKAAVDRHGIPVVVTVRPATAIAASYVRMRWKSGLQPAMESLAQIGITFPELMANFGKYLGNRPIEAAMLWYVTYSTLLQWAETRPLIHFVSTQDSIDRPVNTYRSLFAVLDLPWSHAVERKLRRRYAAACTIRKPDEVLPPRAHVRRRNLGEVNTYGAKLLTADERRIIEEISEEPWCRLKAACLALCVQDTGPESPHELG